MITLLGSLCGNFSCFLGPPQRSRTEKYYEDKLTNLDEEISVLPFLTNLDLDDIYPTDHQPEQWSIFIIGKNKKLLLSQDFLGISGHESLVNQDFTFVLRGNRAHFFQTMFSMIMDGVEAQFLFIQNEKLYYASIFCFKNLKKESIGGVIFIRKFTSVKNMLDMDKNTVPPRKSKEFLRVMKLIREEETT